MTLITQRIGKSLFKVQNFEAEDCGEELTKFESAGDLRTAWGIMLDEVCKFIFLCFQMTHIDHKIV